MFKNLSDDERKFVWFWLAVFSSALGFWTLVVRWAWQFVATHIT